MFKRTIKWALLGAGIAALSACGDTLGEQALIGGGVGAAGAVVADGDAVTGAVIGAAANVAYCQQYPSRC
jgi:hypothetical protein